MALDQTARADASGEPSETEYDTIHDTMMASARGRWFLNEYARRNRSADTNAVLSAIDQIGAHLRGEALPPEAPEYLHLGLTTMAALVAAVEADMSALSTGHESEAGAKPRVARVVSTLRDLGDCIQVMLDGWKTPRAAAVASEPPASARAAVPPLTLVQPIETEPVAVAAAASETDAEPPMHYESDFVPFEIDAPEEMTATAGDLLPSVEPLGPRVVSKPAAKDYSLAELRALGRDELIALFS
jgi:hypothetical protein